jgi:hypothetical protein
MRKLLLATVGTATILGCSNSPTGNSVSSLMTVADSATMVRTNRALANVVLTDFGDACSVADERTHPSSKMLTFLLTDMDAPPATPGDSSGGPPSKPGTFQIFTLEALPATGLVGECGFASLDGTCKSEAPSGECTSGSVTLTRVDAAGYAGKFDVVIDGNHVTGTFDSPVCDNVSETGFGTCE